MNPDVARLESERLRPPPKDPTWQDTLQQLVGVLARLLLHPPPPDQEPR
jgi:hypothetical protein